MKVAVSIPEDVFELAERLGRRLKVSRSRLYATAIVEYLARHDGRKVTDRLNQVYGLEGSRLAEPLRRMQAQSIGGDEW